MPIIIGIPAGSTEIITIKTTVDTVFVINTHRKVLTLGKGCTDAQCNIIGIDPVTPHPIAHCK